MKAEIKNNACIVTREQNDPCFYGKQNASGESKLLYHVKNILNKQGYDLIKKRMYKDGHLVDDLQQYLRVRKATGNPEKDICIYNQHWSIQGAETAYNKTGRTVLYVMRDLFQK